MDKDIITLISILNKTGYRQQALEIIAAEKKKVKIKVDPLSLAVALGLVNPNTLEAMDDENSVDNFQEILDRLTEQEKQTKESA